VGTNCPITCNGPCDFNPVDCGVRWYFGSAYHNPDTVEDMQDCGCPPGSLISEIDFAFFWGDSRGSRCIVIFFPLEEVLSYHAAQGLCTDPGSMTGTGGGGVALDFGSLPANSPGSFYWSRAAGLDGLGMLSPTTDDN